MAIADHCSDEDGLAFKVLHSTKGVEYCGVSVLPGSTIGDRLREAIRSMNQQGVHVGILPELTMLPELLQIARDTTCEVHDAARGTNSLRVLVAGSLHEPSGELVKNISHVIAGDGSLLWVQEKMSPFAWTVSEAPHQEALDTRTRVLRVCDLWFGRTVVAICLDYLVEVVQQASIDLAVSCFLVPAMTPGTREFKKMAMDYVRATQAGSLVANAYLQTPPPERDGGASFASRPKRGSEDEVLTTFGVRPGPYVDVFRVG